jgi:hypothetical protein
VTGYMLDATRLYAYGDVPLFGSKCLTFVHTFGKSVHVSLIPSSKFQVHVPPLRSTLAPTRDTGQLVYPRFRAEMISRVACVLP